MRFPGFIGPSYTSQSVNVDCQRCVNLYPEVNPLGTGKEREVAALVPTPGLRLLLTLATGPVRGIHTASNGELYAVGGNKLYKISSAWVATEIGSLNTSEGHVSIADNGLHVVVVDGTDGYVWTIATSEFAEITDSDFLGADQVTFIDSYFVFNKPDSGQFYYTGLLDVTFDALDIQTAEGKPDNLVGLVNSHQNLFLFGDRSIEVFYNAGGAGDVFARIQGAVVDVGCASAFSIAKLDNAIYFMGGDENGHGIVYRMQGYQPERISTPAIESVIRGLDQDTISESRAWTYQQGGHGFYCLNLPGADATWVYDASTGLWHERVYLGTWELERHRADCHAVAHGQNVVGDYSDGKIYALDPDTYTDNGTAIVRKRAAPHLSRGLKNLFHTRFQLDMETGVGIDGTGQGSDPQATLRWSDDGGHTWSNGRQGSIGKIGQKKKRVFWNRLGASRDRVYEVTISDPVKCVLIGAEIEFQEGVA